jgi:(p)ppGpp synthase/HD superfamily hydrolase
LHDVVEDTEITRGGELKELFGERIANLVRDASEPDKEASWEERKKHTIEISKNIPFESKILVCADKVHNLQSLLHDKLMMGEAVWDSFKRGKEKQKWYYTNLYESLCHGVEEKDRTKLFQMYEKVLKDLF